MQIHSIRTQQTVERENLTESIFKLLSFKVWIHLYDADTLVECCKQLLERLATYLTYELHTYLKFLFKIDKVDHMFHTTISCACLHDTAFLTFYSLDSTLRYLQTLLSVKTL